MHKIPPVLLVLAAACGLLGASCTGANPSFDMTGKSGDLAQSQSGDMTGKSGDLAQSQSGDMTGNPGDMAGNQGTDMAPPGMPITAPAGQWTWIPFPDSACGNGVATGIGVNLSTKSSRVLIYLEGGGACWNELTCYRLMSASYFTTGYTEADFTAESTDKTYLAEPGGPFDRSAADNPFQDYSYVYVPYCTGDVHAGDNVIKYGTHTAHHVGYQNLGAFLQRIVPTFPAAERVYLSGSSAGGYGALFNWWRVQQAFGNIRVDMIDDSGTPMPNDILAKGIGSLTTEATERANWNLAATLPGGCTACTQSLDGIFGFLAQSFPNQRGALLSYNQDTVLPAFLGITTAQFETGLGEEEKTNFDPYPNRHYFVVNAKGHVLLFDPTLSTQGTTLQTWLTQMVSDNPAWTSDAP